jgi:hypothetical protein
MTIVEIASRAEESQKNTRVFWNAQSGSAELPQYEYFETEGITEPEVRPFELTSWSKVLHKTQVGHFPSQTQTPEDIIGGSAIFLRTPSWVGKYHEIPQSSTLQQDYPDAIDQEIELLFDRAKEEVFEDGMESDFSRGLISYVRKFGDTAIAALVRLIVTEQANAEVASEAMRWLGHIDHPITYRSRLHLLERSLHNSSARVRDGAALGLASLDDPHAIPYLKQAIEREQYQELRYDLEQVVIQLESTYSVFSVENNSEIQVV